MGKPEVMSLLRPLQEHHHQGGALMHDQGLLFEVWEELYYRLGLMIGQKGLMAYLQETTGWRDLPFFQEKDIEETLA
jgi:hypothetical protein